MFNTHAGVNSTGLRIGFSTLGCPTLGPVEIRTLAAQSGIRYIEIRTLGGSLNFVQQLAMFPGGAAGVRDFLLEADVRVRLVGSSFLLTKAARRDREALLAEAEAGEAMGASWLRVFGGGDWGDPLTPAAAAVARDHRAWWQAIRAARGWKIDLILEIHDAFSGSSQVHALMEHTGASMPLLWDTHHTWKIAGESAEHTWSQLAPMIVHVHMKDSIARPSGRHDYTYVPQGEGEFPTQEILELLQRNAFGGVVSLEWEKQWHPELAELEKVLPAWCAVTAPYGQVPAIPAHGPRLLLKCDFNTAQIVPSAGPYFHGGREQYEDILCGGPVSHPTTIGEPTAEIPRLGALRIYYEGGDASQRWARLVPDETDSKKTVLRFHISAPNVVIQWPEGPQPKSRIQAEIYGNLELRDFYQKVRFRFSADAAQLQDYPQEIKWLTLMEFWTNSGWVDDPYPYRFGLHVLKPDPAPGTPLYFATGSQYQVDAKTYCDVWHEINQTLPMPFGAWMTLETYYREGNASTGRFFAAVTPDGGSRTVLFDVRGFTHHPKNPHPRGMTQFSPLKLYTSAELVNFLKERGKALQVDWADLELYNGMTPEDFAK